MFRFCTSTESDPVMYPVAVPVSVAIPLDTPVIVAVPAAAPADGQRSGRDGEDACLRAGQCHRDSARPGRLCRKQRLSSR